MTDGQRPIEENPMEKYLKKPGTNPMPIAFLRGLLGAILGGAIGYFGFFWLTRFQIYALVLPGAMLGLGFGLAAGRKSYGFGVFCAVAAFFLGCVAEWKRSPFLADESFSFFVTHLNHLDHPAALILLILGVVMAFWFGRGR